MILDAPESAADGEQLKKLVALGYSLSAAKCVMWARRCRHQGLEFN
jgi:hypothetical protein